LRNGTIAALFIKIFTGGRKKKGKRSRDGRSSLEEGKGERQESLTFSGKKKKSLTAIAVALPLLLFRKGGGGCGGVLIFGVGVLGFAFLSLPFREKEGRGKGGVGTVSSASSRIFVHSFLLWKEEEKGGNSIKTCLDVITGLTQELVVLKEKGEGKEVGRSTTGAVVTS